MSMESHELGQKEDEVVEGVLPKLLRQIDEMRKPWAGMIENDDYEEEFRKIWKLDDKNVY